MPPDPIDPRPPADAATPAAMLELGPLVTRISLSLGGGVPRERIEQVLRDLLEQEFSEARVTAFLPVFLHRYAIETLRHVPPPGGAVPPPPRPGLAGSAHV
jgi:hypothetical protein